jgi:hypothetical protein
LSNRGGWDNHPEYGGPEPSWRGAFVFALVIVVIAGLIVLAVKWKHPLRLAHQVVQRHELTRIQIFRIVHANPDMLSGRPLTFRGWPRLVYETSGSGYSLAAPAPAAPILAPQLRASPIINHRVHSV